MEILDLEGNQLTGELPDCWMKWRSLKMLNLGNNMLSGSIPNSIGLLVHLLSLNLYNNRFSGQIPLSMQNCTRLLKIDFGGNDLDGNIPTWVGTNLGNLRILILRSNKLSGEIALDICRLKSLQILDLSDNMVSGIIPRCVDNFTAMTTKRSLVDQYEHWTTLTTTEESFLESASMVTKGRQLLYDTILPLVTNIDLSQNNLSGDIPKELTSLVELRSLNVSGNHLTGLIPDNIGNMKQLESLDFSRNSLFGEIPSSSASMSSLNYLNLSYNNLTGRIPESTQLRGFNESSFIGNNLCGPQLKISCSIDGNPPAPTHKEDQDQEDDKSEIECSCIGNNSSNTIIACPEIEKQALLSFKQSLKDPSNLLSSWDNGEVNCCMWKGVFCNNLTGHVIELHLQSHDWFQGLYGKINPSLLNLKHLKYLDLSQNKFNETMIPSFIGSLTSLEYLNLSDAGFYGKIPHNIGNLSNLHTLVLEDSNSQSLDVDSLEWLPGLSKLEHLNMNSVNLRKVVNWAHVINKLPSLIELHFSHCSLNDNNDNVANNITNSLAILDLSSNNFQSLSITRWIFQLTNLIFLDLRFNSFEGPIPTTSNTTKLRHINLFSNNFNSTIPDWLYTCKDLEFVSLGSNHLQGTISNAIANLTSLRFLDLFGNELSGKIPREIGNLCKMRILVLSYNMLAGEISDSFGNMPDCFLGALEDLDLSYNQLSGHLTHQFGEFESLRTFDLRTNSLSGVIPNNLGNLSSLEYLNLGSNKLTGNLPESVGQLSNLKYLSIEDNMLEGIVTETHFAHLSNLIELSASRNNLTLKVINPNWIPPFKLTSLQLRSWNLGSGSGILLWIETQKNNMNDLDLSKTGISGNVPSWFWNIRFLNISHNQLHGKIPNINGPKHGFSSLVQFVYLSSNKFSGPLPRVGNTVIELDLSNNSFSGGISHFFCDTTTNETNGLRVLHLGGNHLSGELPQDCLMKWPSLTMLNLGNNNLSGTIPNSIGFLANLRSLNLYSNKFSGHIPFSMRNCTELLKIDLANNNLDGTIPTWMGASLSNLRFLILRSNKFTGEINSHICQLWSLHILDLSNNKFSGIIPRCFDNFTVMTTTENNLSEYDLQYSLYWSSFIESASVTTKGSKLHYDTILRLVTNIDLSNNNLSGDIPKEITSLLELRSLNLSGNHLTGLIPDSIGNMKQLESLDFSRNSLSGEIPSSFTIMSSLSYLNLSCNNLTGKVPESTQLLSFNEFCKLKMTVSKPHILAALLKDNSESLEVDSLEWLSGLTKLDHLNLNSVNLNKATNWAQVINKLPPLVELHFSFCSLNNFRTPQNNLNNNITSLAILDLSGNFFQSFGVLRWIFQLSNLIFLDLNFNFFEGPIPSITNTSCKLQHIDLSNNLFNSTIPEWLYFCKGLEFVSLGLNHLQGTISNSIANMTSLKTLDLPSNELSGNIPREITNLCKMQSLDLGWNKLAGEISDSFGNMSDCFLGALEYLDMSHNQLSGNLTHQFGEFKSLRTLDLRRNSLSGVIPNNLGNLYSLEFLYLGSNKLTGNLPESMGQLSHLKALYINDNMLEGNCTLLMKIDLADNHLDGNITTWMGTSLSNLRFLILRSNKLTGEITSNICYLNALQILDLSDNMVSGTIPKCVDNFTAMVIKRDLSEFYLDEIQYYIFSKGFLESASITTKGSELYYDTILSLVTNIDLSKNNLSGDIPKEITSLVELRSLNLSGNHFSGLIPDSIGNMKQLESLDFSRNSLSGEIPSSFTSMSSLNYLNLSSNNLTGKIPESTQLLGLSLALLGTIFVVLH
ncbi:LOW QUALITY PROTEIN: hypothetical protein DH2020_027981 [Rehmannia glutinosa]|uniref:Uncharacterized protein n=1 Tax=Rehmannia glutinosa TaxID=99300 RepID=A0ABR0VSP5_REHGL